MSSVNRVFLEKLGGSQVETFIGTAGDLFYDTQTRLLKISDGVTPGGIAVQVEQFASTIFNADILPSISNVYSVGSTEMRWKELFVGPGSLVLQDQVTGLDVFLTILDGVLLIDGIAGSQVGNIQITIDGLKQTVQSQNIEIGQSGDSGKIKLYRDLEFSDGTVQTTAYYPHLRGLFSSNVIQGNPVASVARAMIFDVTTIQRGVSIVDQSRITIAESHDYNLQFSAQIDRSHGGTDTVDIWFRKNGIDLPNSNTELLVTGQAAAQAIVASWNFIVQATAGDYFEIMWQSADTGILLNYRPPKTNPTRPATPQVILTVESL